MQSNNQKKFAVIIGEEIVNECLDRKININTSKLIKLLYYMQKLHLQKYGKPMFLDEIIATINGPYIEEVGDYFNSGRLGFEKHYEKRIVFMDSHEDVTQEILKQYGDMSSSELMKLSQDDEAYKIIWENGKGNCMPIPIGILANNPSPVLCKKMYK